MESQVSLESCSPLLTRSDDYWSISTEVAKKDGFLRAEVGEEDQLVPPVNGWQFKEWRGTKWSSDGTLECSREVSEPCTKIVVELHGEAKKEQSYCAGTYLPVKGVVVRGRPVGSDDDNWFVNRTVKTFEQQFDFHDSHWVAFHQERKVMMMVIVVLKF